VEREGLADGGIEEVLKRAATDAVDVDCDPVRGGGGLTTGTSSSSDSNVRSITFAGLRVVGAGVFDMGEAGGMDAREEIELFVPPRRKVGDSSRLT
jgi:hypothetical protein